MAETVTLSPKDLAGLAAKLDALGEQLSEGERMLLAALFDVAGRALAAEPSEVEGYLLLPAVQKVREAAIRSSSNLGADFLGALPDAGTVPTEQISINFTKIEF